MTTKLCDNTIAIIYGFLDTCSKSELSKINTTYYKIYSKSIKTLHFKYDDKIKIKSPNNILVKIIKARSNAQKFIFENFNIDEQKYIDNLIKYFEVGTSQFRKIKLYYINPQNLLSYELTLNRRLIESVLTNNNAKLESLTLISNRNRDFILPKSLKKITFYCLKSSLSNINFELSTDLHCARFYGYDDLENIFKSLNKSLKLETLIFDSMDASLLTNSYIRVQLSASTWNSVKRLELRNFTLYYKNFEIMLPKFPNLEYLYINLNCVQELDLGKYVPKLKHLILNYDRVDSINSFEILVAHLPLLETFCCNSNIMNVNLEVLSNNCPLLEVISIHSILKLDQIIILVNKCPKLKILQIYNSSTIVDVNVVAYIVEKLQYLKHLYLKVDESTKHILDKYPKYYPYESYEKCLKYIYRHHIKQKLMTNPNILL
jgi:hypothetical protein